MQQPILDDPNVNLYNRFVEQAQIIDEMQKELHAVKAAQFIRTQQSQGALNQRVNYSEHRANDENFGEYC